MCECVQSRSNEIDCHCTQIYSEIEFEKREKEQKKKTTNNQKHDKSGCDHSPCKISLFLWLFWFELFRLFCYVIGRLFFGFDWVLTRSIKRLKKLFYPNIEHRTEWNMEYERYKHIFYDSSSVRAHNDVRTSSTFYI